MTLFNSRVSLLSFYLNDLSIGESEISRYCFYGSICNFRYSIILFCFLWTLVHLYLHINILIFNIFMMDFFWIAGRVFSYLFWLVLVWSLFGQILTWLHLLAAWVYLLWISFFHPFTLRWSLSLVLKRLSWRQQKDGSCFLIQYVTLCLSID